MLFECLGSSDSRTGAPDRVKCYQDEEDDDDYNDINSMMAPQMINGGNVAKAEGAATDNDQLIDIYWRNARWRNLSEN